MAVGRRQVLAIASLASAAVAMAAGSALAQTPSPYAGYIGDWKGTWPHGPTQSIVVKAVDPDGAMHGVYSWGAYPKIKLQAGTFEFNHIKPSADGKFTVTDGKNAPGRSEWQFKDGKLLGTRYDSAGGLPTNTVVLLKGN